jgi:acetylornithine/succinyldiaminopimelate/putrescine aminotransferase
MEAGARIFDSDYLEQLQSLCERYGTLSIFDEIQTGLGRTGEVFAFQHTQAKPDVVLLGKALGAGLVPISASIFKRGVWEKAYDSALRSEIHNSTLGGNALGCAVALAVLGELKSPGFLAQVRERSEQLAHGLAGIRQRRRSVERVSLRGLLGGIRLKNRPHPWATWSGLGMPELEPNPSLGALLLQRLGKFGILAHVCGHDWSVLRIEPPLIISAQQCEAFLSALDSGLEWLEQNVIET